MKRSFFIALGFYIALFASLATLYKAPRAVETRRIALNSITIKKAPKCACKPCRCTDCAAHPKAVQKPKKTEPPKKPAIKKEPPKKELPKKLAKKPPIKKKPVKKVKKRKLKRPKTLKKLPKKIARPTKKAAPPTPRPQPAVASPAPPPKAAAPGQSACQKAPAPAKKPAKSYQQRFAENSLGRIRDAIVRNVRYPRIARKTKKQGVVEVGFTLLPTKELENLRIVKSSGHRVLDKAAIKSVKRASKEFPAPKERVELRVPIEFRLR